jgi:hypothetical protein
VILRRRGYGGDEFSGTSEARTALALRRYDLMLAARRMDGNKELEFAEEMLKVQRNVPIFVISFNDQLGRYEFQIVQNYAPSERPNIRNANRKLCLFEFFTRYIKRERKLPGES